MGDMPGCIILSHVIVRKMTHSIKCEYHLRLIVNGFACIRIEID